MPQKNAIKEYAADSYYHVYFRGVNKQKIFLEITDYIYFESLLGRYLGDKKIVSKVGVLYPNYSDRLELLSYCLMSNHVHLLLYQGFDVNGLPKLMSSMLTSYSKYFNRKYKRRGTLYESRYKAKRVDNDSYLMHISRYIHMNPRRWQAYKHSSLQYIFVPSKPAWLKPGKLEASFVSGQDYQNFLTEYQENKESLEYIKHQLADTE